MKRLALVICSFLWTTFFLPAQDSGTEFVKKQYPKLSSMFQKELASAHATYTFAIDVSGTMNKYSGIVIPALDAFVDALPDGDYVRIIRFGTSAKGSDNGYLGTITPKLKADLKSSVQQLYTNINDDKSFRAHTDIPAVMKEISSALVNSDNNMNFVFILTDFRNDQTDGGEHRLTKKMLDTIYYDLESASSGKNGRIIALRLPVDVNAPGYCLDQLRDKVFSNDDIDLDYEMQDITSNHALSSWFDDLKKQIMVERLRTIVSAENKVTDIDFSTDIDIDGNVVARIFWNPNRLYASIQIDSSFVQDPVPEGGRPKNSSAYTQSGFTLKNNVECFTTTTQTALGDIKLGKIKNRKFGFHKLDDSLALGVRFPTPYDDELHRLGIKKPIPDVAIRVNQWIFTFFLPLLVCSIILGLFLLYIILVICKAASNAKASFSKTIKVYDYDSQDLVVKVTEKIRNRTGYSVPRLSGLGLTYKKKTYSPFLLFKKPRLVGEVQNGIPCNAKGQKDTVKTNGTFYIQDKGKNFKYKISIS